MSTDRDVRIQAFLRKWYPEMALEVEEVFVPTWFDGSPEAVARLGDGIRSALTRTEERRAEELSAVSALTGLSEERIEELGGI